MFFSSNRPIRGHKPSCAYRERWVVDEPDTRAQTIPRLQATMEAIMLGADFVVVPADGRTMQAYLKLPRMDRLRRALSGRSRDRLRPQTTDWSAWVVPAPVVL